MSSLEPAEVPTTLLPSSTTASTSSSSSPSTPASSSSPTAKDDDSHGSNSVFPPMTTHWTKPQSCTWTYVVDDKRPPASPGAIAWLDLEPIPGASTLSCYPDGMFFGGRTGVFSPATCPSGWTTVSLRVNTNKDLDKTTTTAVCCSSYYSLDGSHCKRSVPTVLAVPITYNHSNSSYEVLSYSTTTLYSATIAVNTIRALFMEQDKKLLGLTDDEEISEDEVPPPSLSAGVRIGIAIGVTVFALLSIGGIAFCLLRWRRSRKRRAKERRPHELNFVHAGSQGTYAPDGSRFGTHDQSVAEPPPAYEPSTVTSSTAEPDSETTGTRQDEIRALVAQKAVIQQRIEELERADAESAQDCARNDS